MKGRNNKRSDEAYLKMIQKADALESKLGERTNVETIHEGITIFTYRVWFCNELDYVTQRTIKINLKG